MRIKFIIGLGICYYLLLRNSNRYSNTVTGLGLTAASLRDIGSKNDYKQYIAPSNQLGRNDNVIIRNASIDDTVKQMIRIVKQYHTDVTQLTNQLYSNDILKFSQNIWNFIYKYIQYVPDSRLFEQLRRPLRTLHDQRGDCDCYSILAASILYSSAIQRNCNIPIYFRISEYENRGYFQHVYVVVKANGKEIIIDPVVDKFNYEKPPTKIKDYRLC